MKAPFFSAEDRRDWAWATVFGVLGGSWIFFGNVSSTWGIGSVIGGLGIVFLIVRFSPLGARVEELLSRFIHRPTLVPAVNSKPEAEEVDPGAPLSFGGAIASKDREKPRR